MNICKKLGLSLVAAALLFNGCAVTNVNVNEKDFDYKEIHNQVNKELPAIQEIYTKDYVQKMEHTNHNIPNSSMKISTKNTTLENILKMIPINHQIDKEFKNLEIKQINHDGDLVSLLDKICEMTGLYWTYKNDTVTFSRTKIIVYKFPIFSAEKLNLIFNITSDASDQFNVSSIKTDVFDEIKTSLDAIMSEYNTEESFEEFVERNNTNGKVRENSKLNNDKVQTLDRLIKTLNDTKTEDYTNSNVDKLSNNETTLEQLTLNNGFERNNKKSAPTQQAGGTTPPADTKKVLEYDIKKTNNTNGNNENIKALSENKENKKVSQLADTLENGKTNQLENQKEYVDNNRDTLENKENSKIVSLYKKTINQERINVSVLKESGMVVVNVDRDTEKKVDTVLKSITENIMSNLVVIDLYIVEANVNKLKKLTSEFAKTTNKNGAIKNTTLDGTGFTFSRDSIGPALATLTEASSGSIRNGSILTALINYTTENQENKVLTNPKILSIPNVPARIKSSTAIPYLDIKSLGGTEEGPEMEISYINEGTDIALLSNVYGEDIFMSLGIKLNKFIRYETLQAGNTIGEFKAPIQSPRTLNTTFRMKAGEITILGGMKGLEYNKDTNLKMGIFPSDVGSSSSKTELLIIAAPRLIKYVKQENK